MIDLKKKTVEKHWSTSDETKTRGQIQDLTQSAHKSPPPGQSVCPPKHRERSKSHTFAFNL